MCDFKDFKFEVMRENISNYDTFVIDFAGNFVPINSTISKPKLVIDYTTDLEIEYEKIIFYDDFILIEN